LNRYAYCRNNPLNYVDPTGYGFKSSFKNFFNENAGWIALIPVVGPSALLASSAYTENWKPAANIFSATASAFVTSGGNPFVAAGVYVSSAITFETQVGRDATALVAHEFFDDVCGMRPGSAYAWSGATLSMAIAIGFQSFCSSTNHVSRQGKKTGNSKKALVVDKGKAASGDSIISDPGVLEEFKKAYADQLSTGNEQGGWITREPSMPGSIRNAPSLVERFSQGENGTITIPKTRPSWTVGEFHTHPPGGILKPSFPDYLAARMNPALYGIKTYIVGEQGVISYAPADNMADLGSGTYEGVVKW
jgi:hypothetical protein